VIDEKRTNTFSIDDISPDSLEFKNFPLPHWAEFRVYLDDKILKDSFEHANSDTSVEGGGLLLGQVYRDDAGPYVSVNHILKAKETKSSQAQITFTHDTWTHFWNEIDENYSDQKIVGWYHSHPGFGIFLSEMDLFIQREYFNNPWQVALVVDPISMNSGVFVWKQNDIIPCERFFIGKNEVKVPGYISHSEKLSNLAEINDKVLYKIEKIERNIHLTTKLFYFSLFSTVLIGVLFGTYYYLPNH